MIQCVHYGLGGRNYGARNEKTKMNMGVRALYHGCRLLPTNCWLHENQRF